jgi:predicted ATPase with chaperone activity
VRAALSSIGLALPSKRTAVNLAPADVLKEGAHFYLPIAWGLLVVMGAVPQDAVVDRVVRGELAFNGVLFLHELVEFARPVLNSLRQPLETGQIVVARANHNVTFPVRFQLVAALNPYRCGYLGDPSRACDSAPTCGRKFAARVSGPMSDRFDLIIEVRK